VTLFTIRRSVWYCRDGPPFRELVGGSEWYFVDPPAWFGRNSWLLTPGCFSGILPPLRCSPYYTAGMGRRCSLILPLDIILPAPDCHITLS